MKLAHTPSPLAVLATYPTSYTGHSASQHWRSMTLRTLPNTIESLRIVIKAVDQGAGRGHNSADLAEPRQILIHSIAELECPRRL